MAANDRHAIAEARQSAANMAKIKTTANVSIDKPASIWPKETGRKYTQIKRQQKRDIQR